MKEIEILGTKYSIKKDSPKTNSKLVNANAYVELQSKEIILDKTKYNNDYNAVKESEKFDRKVLRHEVVHAFLHESGLAALSANETITDWIAAQYPKLKEAFSKLKIED